MRLPLCPSLLVGLALLASCGPGVSDSLQSPLDPVIPGTALEVVIMNSRRPAVVLGEAAYDPQNIRPRSDISTSAEPKGMTA